MGGTQAAWSTAAVLAAVVAMLVDGRLAVPVATTVLALGLTPEAAAVAGGPGVLVLVGSAVAAVVIGRFAAAAGRRLARGSGPDPVIPAFAPRQRLFGHRSVRVMAAALGIPVASWVSFHMPIGEVAVVTGLLFPVAYVWVCALLRLVVARHVEDLAVAVAMLSLAGATGWLVRAGPDALRDAAALSALAPAAAALSGWLRGRHRRREPSPPAIAAASP